MVSDAYSFKCFKILVSGNDIKPGQGQGSQRHHVCLLLSRGYSTKHVVEGLEPRTLYRFRLKVTSPSGEYEYSPVVSVATTSEYTHAPCSVLIDMKPTSILERKVVCVLPGLTRSRENSICKLYDTCLVAWATLQPVMRKASCAFPNWESWLGTRIVLFVGIGHRIEVNLS